VDLSLWIGDLEGGVGWSLACQRGLWRRVVVAAADEDEVE
jgi:hypothetical protein